MICKQEIPDDPISAVTGDKEEIYESENEYHDAMSELRELTERLDINKDHNDLKPVFIGTKCINDETSEIKEYQEPLINVEEDGEIVGKHATDKDEIYHDTVEAVENPKSLVLNKETASESGIDEEEEYYDPMAMEQGLGAADDSGGNKLSSRITEPDPRGLLSSVLVPNISLMESMRLWVFSTNKQAATTPYISQ